MKKVRKRKLYRSQQRGGLRFPLRAGLFLLVGLLCIVGTAACFTYLIQNQIPESLLELKEKYPQTAAFVDSYPWKKNLSFSLDLSEEVAAGTVPLFLQWDERWGYRTYGNNFFAVNGCGPTCLSMVVCGLTGNTDWNPYAVGVFSENSGYYVPGEGTAWSLMTEGAASLGLVSQCGEASAAYISGQLSQGHPIICSMYPGDFTYTGHFIVLTEVDEAGNVAVNDPNSRENSERHWRMEELLPQIHALWSFSEH